MLRFYSLLLLVFFSDFFPPLVTLYFGNRNSIIIHFYKICENPNRSVSKIDQIVPEYFRVCQFGSLQFCISDIFINVNGLITNCNLVDSFETKRN